MKSSGVFFLLLLWTALLTSAPVEGSTPWYESRHQNRAEPYTQLNPMVTAQVNKEWFQKFYPLKMIESFFHKLAEANRPLVRFEGSVGKTLGGNSIFAVHITSSGEEDVPKIYIQCLIHAREWVAGSVCQHFANHLVEKKKEEDVKRLLNMVEFIIVPVANPDGYARTWETEDTYEAKIFQGGYFRFWRKNTGGVKGKEECVGVDLNRNFPKGWEKGPVIKDKTGSTTVDTCANSYSGPDKASEQETQAIMNYILRHKPILGLMDFHCFYQAVLFPYGYTKSEQAPNSEDLFRVAYLTAHAISKVHKQIYTAMNAHTFQSISKGNLRDWAYSDEVAEHNMDSKKNRYRVISLGVELRPHTSSYGKQRYIDKCHPGTRAGNYKSDRETLRFLLPENEILPTCEEATAGIMEFTKLVLKNPIMYRRGSKNEETEQKHP